MILVTGGGGFVGGGVIPALVAAGHRVRACDRQDAPTYLGHSEMRRLDLEREDSLAPLVAGVHTVVHLAARAHMVRDTAADPLAAFRSANVEVTRRLAEACVAAGVRRFIFLSSVGVLGESSPAGPFNAWSAPAPGAPYAVSKLEAEQVVAEVARGKMEVVVIRPPLVHGPGAPGNFGRLLRLVSRGLPLPFGGLTARRTFVSRANLASLIVTALDHPSAPHAPLLAGDSESLTLPELLRTLGEGMGREVRLIPVPGLRLARHLPLIGSAVQKLTDPLEVDITATTAALGWRPPQSARDGLREMARAWQGRR